MTKALVMVYLAIIPGQETDLTRCYEAYQVQIDGVAAYECHIDLEQYRRDFYEEIKTIDVFSVMPG